MGVSFGCFSLGIWLLALFSEPLVRTDACVLGLACKQGALGVGMDIRTFGNRSHELGCANWDLGNRLRSDDIPRFIRIAGIREV